MRGIKDERQTMCFLAMPPDCTQKRKRTELVLPWRQVARAAKLAGTSRRCIVPPNQTIRIRRSTKRDRCSISLNFEVHGSAQDEARIRKSSRRDRPRRKTAVEVDCSADAEASFGCGIPLVKLSIPVNSISSVGG